MPSDQTAGKHAFYHEDLIFKAAEALNATIKEFLDKEPMIPSKEVESGK